MGMFLNVRAPYEIYRKIVKNPYFIDKSLLLAELMPLIGSINCYCCITPQLVRWVLYVYRDQAL